MAPARLLDVQPRSFFGCPKNFDFSQALPNDISGLSRGLPCTASLYSVRLREGPPKSQHPEPELDHPSCHGESLCEGSVHGSKFQLTIAADNTC